MDGRQLGCYIYVATNVKDFSRRIKLATRKLPAQKSLLLQKKVALEALRSLVFMTPVDTGRARGNWVVTMNTPSKANPFKGDMRIRQGGDFDANSAAATAFAMEQTSKILSYQRMNQVIWITNNTPYILELEGVGDAPGPTSSQAPAGMLRITKLRLELMFGF